MNDVRPLTLPSSSDAANARPEPLEPPPRAPAPSHAPPSVIARRPPCLVPRARPGPKARGSAYAESTSRPLAGSRSRADRRAARPGRMPGMRGARRVARHARESLPRRPTPRRALAFAPARRMPVRSGPPRTAPHRPAPLPARCTARPGQGITLPAAVTPSFAPCPANAEARRDLRTTCPRCATADGLRPVTEDGHSPLRPRIRSNDGGGRASLTVAAQR